MHRVEIGAATMYRGDCCEILPTLGPVDLVLTDPPYFRVKGDYWDNQWDDDRAFLAWLGGVVDLLAARMASNASLYLFASPAMASRVEIEISQRLHVLNHLVWRKGAPGRKSISVGNRADKSALRSWWPESERIVFAEHYDSDQTARSASPYQRACDDLRACVFEPIRAYLEAERERAGVTPAEVNEATGTKMAGHWFGRSQWAMPSEEHYQTMQRIFRERGAARALERDHGALCRDYGAMQSEYEALRIQYDDLRRQFENLRRPFSVGDTPQWSDVWDFDPVSAYPGKHPCEKPLTLLSHIIAASSRPGALVLDAFAGSGSTGHAALMLGRRFIGIERDPVIFDQACERLAAFHSQLSLI